MSIKDNKNVHALRIKYILRVKTNTNMIQLINIRATDLWPLKLKRWPQITPEENPDQFASNSTSTSAPNFKIISEANPKDNRKAFFPATSRSLFHSLLPPCFEWNEKDVLPSKSNFPVLQSIVISCMFLAAGKGFHSAHQVTTQFSPVDVDVWHIKCTCE